MVRYLLSVILASACLLGMSLELQAKPSTGRMDVLSYVGSFTHSIPIPVAPGRAGMQPSLALKYSSSMGNSIYGYGWDLDITRIERGTKLGAPKYNTQDYYVLVMKGARLVLSYAGGNEYRVANESAFLKITKTAAGWLITDRNKTEYRLNARWPVNGSKIFSWSLSGVRDVFGNRITYTYADGGRGHRLKMITYPPGNKVLFTYEPRPDPILSYRSGLRQLTTVRLRSVRSYATMGNQSVLASRMEFRYARLVSTISGVC